MRSQLDSSDLSPNSADAKASISLPEEETLVPQVIMYLGMTLFTVTIALFATTIPDGGEAFRSEDPEIAARWPERLKSAVPIAVLLCWLTIVLPRAWRFVVFFILFVGSFVSGIMLLGGGGLRFSSFSRGVASILFFALLAAMMSLVSYAVSRLKRRMGS